MIAQTFTTTASPYRSAGWAAIISGIIGFLAFGFLVAFLIPHMTEHLRGGIFIRSHDVAVIFQFLVMIPVVFGLYKLSYQRSPGMSQTMLIAGVGALSFTILFLLLIFPKILNDTLYMFPQGVFGVGLIVVCWRMQGILSRGLRWFGMVVGFGLALVGTFPSGMAIFVPWYTFGEPPAIPVVIPDVSAGVHLADNVFHQLLWIGTLMGVITLPFWTLLLGRRLLRERNS
jgi:hypothetical protein